MTLFMHAYNVSGSQLAHIWGECLPQLFCKDIHDIRNPPVTAIPLHLSFSSGHWNTTRGDGLTHCESNDGMADLYFFGLPIQLCVSLSWKTKHLECNKGTYTLAAVHTHTHTFWTYDSIECLVKSAPLSLRCTTDDNATKQAVSTWRYSNNPTSQPRTGSAL